MAYQITNYDPKFIEQQVDLIWEITDNWKYPYQTSYDSIRQTYSSENFDPTTRFYAIDGDQLLGYISSAVVKDAEKGDYGTLRFPLAKNNNEDVLRGLLEKAENRFLELGVDKIKAPAGQGMGNTMDLAEKFGFKQGNAIFKRSRINIDDLNVSGNFDNVGDFNDSDTDSVKEIFMKKMGMSEKQGEGFFQWAFGNKKRKESNDKNMTSWKVTREEDVLTSFSYLHRSDHNSTNGWFAPIWTSKGVNIPSTYDRILSSHVNAMVPHGMKSMQTYLTTDLLQLEDVYGNFGFKFDATYSYEKILST